MIYGINGWNEIDVDQQSEWLENPEDIPTEVIEDLDLNDLSRLHMLLFGNVLTTLFLAVDEGRSRQMLIDAIQSRKPLKDNVFTKNMPKDAMI